MRMINFGVIGFGTVGSGVVKLFLENQKEIQKRLNFNLNLKKIADPIMKSKEGVEVPQSILTPDAYDIINDPEIDIVVELVGGKTIAKNFIIDAFKNKKHVVTANKALLSEFGYEIFIEASKANCFLGFEASVGGVIPVIRTIKESLAGDKIESIYGIMNGTCNYILTKMVEERKDFKEALLDAQKKGYAEADPTLDIDGIDAAHKLAILTSLAFGTNVNFKDIYYEGIRDITNLDMDFAADFDYTIKLLGIAKDNGDCIEAKVHPTLIPKDHPLSSVRLEYNAIFVKGIGCGPMLLYGKGAGMMPTASAVLGDIIDCARHIVTNSIGAIPNRGYLDSNLQDKQIRFINEIVSKFYIRLMVVDRPGVLASISGILGKKGISIESVVQKGRAENGEGVPLVIFTHETREKELREALKEIESADYCLGKPLILRIEDNI
ncbi:MAG: homoserine dehydrogenase [Proteobacteria bacterium]|nr:homoserine dehydrogenase [Pseudomonadota bacterium]